jgi:hypothetical protein
MSAFRALGKIFGVTSELKNSIEDLSFSEEAQFDSLGYQLND